MSLTTNGWQSNYSLRRTSTQRAVWSLFSRVDTTYPLALFHPWSSRSQPMWEPYKPRTRDPYTEPARRKRPQKLKHMNAFKHSTEKWSDRLKWTNMVSIISSCQWILVWSGSEGMWARLILAHLLITNCQMRVILPGWHSNTIDKIIAMESQMGARIHQAFLIKIMNKR